MFCPKDPKTTSVSGRLHYGLYIYYVSKFYELLDTLFKVLKKVCLYLSKYFHGE